MNSRIPAARARHAVRLARAGLLVLCAALLASAPAQARKHRHKAAAAAHDDTVVALRRVGPGETWAVRQTTHLKKLVIAEGGRLDAPAGRSITLAVNGVGTPIVPGTYAGDVVVHVPLAIRLHEPGLEGSNLRTALYANGNLFLPEKSASALLVGGRVGNDSAAGTSIASGEPDFIGAILAGDGRYALEGVRLAVAGPAVLLAGRANASMDRGSAIESSGTALSLAGQASRLALDGTAVHAGNGVLADFLAGSRAQLILRNGRFEGRVACVAGEGSPPSLALENATWVGEVAGGSGRGSHTLSVSLDGGSRWVLTASSLLESLTLAPGATLATGEGASLALLVDGNVVEIAPGHYTGRVDLQVSATATP